MRLIITGSRDIWPAIQFIDDMVRALFPSFLDDEQQPAILCTGHDPYGVDCQAREWAKHQAGLHFDPGPVYPHDDLGMGSWGQGKSIKRCRRKVRGADAVLLLWDGGAPQKDNRGRTYYRRDSESTFHMFREARRARVPVFNITSLTPERFPDPNLSSIGFTTYRTTGIGVGNTSAITNLQIGGPQGLATNNIRYK